MTTLCAIHHDGETWIGCDTLICNGDVAVARAPKWIVKGGWAIGISGNVRTQNLLMNMEIDFTGHDNPFSLCETLKAILLNDGYESRGDPSGPRTYGQWFILVREDRIWSVAQDFSFIETPKFDLWAEGNGEAYALGAGYALLAADRHWSPQYIVIKALEAAAQFDTRTGGDLWTRRVYDKLED